MISAARPVRTAERRPMLRYQLPLVVLLAVGPAVARPQGAAQRAPSVSKTLAPVGLKVGRVPDLLYEHLRRPNLQPGQGVVVEQVGAGSPAARAGLKRHDILLSF